jgi:hypothetical protein
MKIVELVTEVKTDLIIFVYEEINEKFKLDEIYWLTYVCL